MPTDSGSGPAPTHDETLGSTWAPPYGEIDLRDYLDVLRRRWWMPAIIALSAGAAAFPTDSIARCMSGRG
jgi:hypothetical protein